MKRAALALVLAACSTSSSNDFPPRPGGGGGGVITGGGGSGGTVGDAGIGDGGVGDGGVLLAGRVCIVSDLRTPTVCDTTKDASIVNVTLGTVTPTTGPAKTGEFTIVAPRSNELVWRATGRNFISSVMPFGSDTTIPIVPDVLYNIDLLQMNSVMVLAGQGSVLARVVRGVSPVANVAAATNLTTNNTNFPLYDANDPLVWNMTGPTQTNGTVWLPGVDVTTAPGRITFTPQGGASVGTPVDVVEDQAITFVTQAIP